MRILLYAALLLGSCTTTRPEQPAQPTQRPLVVGNDTVAMVTTIEVGKKSQVSIAVGGHNNSPAATRTDNTGRNASEGANGGNSQPTTINKVPFWAVLLLMFVGGFAGAKLWQWWQQRKARAQEPESG